MKGPFHILHFFILSTFLSNCKSDAIKTQPYPFVTSECPNEPRFNERKVSIHRDFQIIGFGYSEDTVLINSCGSRTIKFTSADDTSIRHIIELPENNLVALRTIDRGSPLRSLDSFEIHIDTSHTVNCRLFLHAFQNDEPFLDSITRAYPIFIRNTSTDTCKIAEDFTLLVQILDQRGQWQNIYSPSFSCGMGKKIFWIAPGEFAITFLPITSGQYRRSVRVTDFDSEVVSDTFHLWSNHN